MMMERVLSLPPYARVAIGGALSLLAFAAWQVVLRGPVAALRTAQAKGAMMAEVQQAPMAEAHPLLPKSGRIVAPSAARAAGRLRDSLSNAAAQHGLLVEDMARKSGSPAVIVAFHLRLSGPEAGVRRFIASVEGDRPVVRFSDWTLRAAGNQSAIQLEATAAALWDKGR